MFKLSRFNNYLEVSDDTLGVYNSNTNNFSLIPKILFVINDNRSLSLKNEDFDISLYRMLHDKGFIVKSELNELDALKIKYEKLFYDSNFGKDSLEEFSLTLFLTLECNFKCAYCFQSVDLCDKLVFPTFMSDITYKNLLSYIDMKTKTYKVFSLDLFGGEPFLSKEYAKKVVSDVKSVCDKNSCCLKNISFTTNGYNLDADLVEFLKSTGSNLFGMITVDGPAETHNGRRFLKNGSPTFDKVYENLKLLKENCGSNTFIRIRMNIDSGNMDRVNELVELLNRDGFQDDKRFSLMFNFVGLTETKSFKDVKGATLECLQPAIALEMAEVYREKFNINSRFNLLFDSLSAYTTSIACNPNHYYVDPLGNLFKCHSDVGEKSKVCGNVNSDFFSTSQNEIDYMKFRAWDKDYCKSCPALPKCVFFCPNALRAEKGCTRYDQAIRQQMHRHLAELAKDPANKLVFDKPYSQDNFFVNV